VSLKEQIYNDIKTALLGGDRFRGEVLKSLKAAILNEEVASNQREAGLGDEVVEQIVAREIKKRNESANIYDGAGRPELAKNERDEAAVMSDYLPEQLTEADIQVAVDKAIQATGATGPADMGRVIGAVKQTLGNSASGAIVAQLVKKSLQ
jgi:uncharacterized protein YqeY